MEIAINGLNNPKNNTPYITSHKRYANYEAWWIYISSRDFEKPFTIYELRCKIKEKTGVMPQQKRLIQYLQEFTIDHGFILISPSDSSGNYYKVAELGQNQLSKISRPSTSLGRPHGKYTNRGVTVENISVREYNSLYQKTSRNISVYMAELLQSNLVFSTPQLAEKILHSTGIKPMLKTLEEKINGHIVNRGKPYIRLVRPGFYGRKE